MRSKDMIIRAWKDPEYRAGLSAEERASLPESPAGQSMAELGEADLGMAVGGGDPGPTSPVHCKTKNYLCEDRYTLNRHVCWQV
jgi:mersacidin/lichenicidin family type 2 lantibiotic